MSNAIRYDSLLVRELARELRRTLAGRRASALLFERETAAVSLRLGREALVWELDARRGDLRRVPQTDRWRGNVPLAAGMVLQDVRAPDDERILTFAFGPEESDHVASGAAALVIELIAPRWNAVALGADGRIHAVLRARAGGSRPLVAGSPWVPPPGPGRRGAGRLLALDDWYALLEGAPPHERADTLLREVAWTSPINARHILGDAAFAGEAALLRGAWERYRALVEPASLTPGVLRSARGPQPYPFALEGERCEPALSLLDAFEAARGITPVSASDASATAFLERLRQRRVRAEARCARLREEMEEAAPRARELRRRADLLLAQLHRVPRGAAEAELDDFAGGSVHLELDPALSAAENAARLYDAARRRERAGVRLPPLLQQAEAEVARIAQLIRDVEAGVVDAHDVMPAEANRAATRGQPRALPYRRYRTSGGLEVRVGRGSASNDQLTLHHSSPNDIWLHAHQVPGAHVVLRWTDRDANPPHADLVEAAVLAALHSRARTSATVAVTWTRRKHVRKPRRARPGLVMVERAKTLFVAPDVDVERRLRQDEVDA